MNRCKYLWITWERQRRNHSLSREISAKLVEIDINAHNLFRYPISICMTIVAIVIHRPKLLVVQNPSIVLALLSIVYHKIVGLPLVVDAHNSGVYPSKRDDGFLNRVARFIIRGSSLTIVTNNKLSEYIKNMGGQAIVVPDPLPELTYSGKKINLKVAIIFCSSAHGLRTNHMLKLFRRQKYWRTRIFIFISRATAKEEMFHISLCQII